jgi:hypothetical protein
MRRDSMEIVNDEVVSEIIRGTDGQSARTDAYRWTKIAISETACLS